MRGGAWRSPGGCSLHSGGRGVDKPVPRCVRASVWSLPRFLSPASAAHLPIHSRNALPSQTRWSPRTSGLVPPNCLPNSVSTLVHRLSARDRPPLNYVKLHDSPPSTWASSAFPGAASSPCTTTRGMTVLSKLLYGSMRVRSFDWVDAATNPTQEPPGRPEIGPCGGQP